MLVVGVSVYFSVFMKVESRISVDRKNMLAIRTTAGSAEEKVPLKLGPMHFAVGTFSDGATYTSDVPNLMLTDHKRIEAEKKLKELLQKITSKHW